MVENNNTTTNTIEKDKIPTTIAIKENGKSSKMQKESEIIEAFKQKRLETMTDEEIIEENLKTILENKSREERKANGRLIAVLVAFLVIFLAIYHAWMRKTAVLAGVLVPAIIMLGYGGWVVILAKRDKRKRAMFEKHIEDVALKNKAELEEKAKLRQSSAEEEKQEPKTKLHFENEIALKSLPTNSKQTVTVHIEDHRKQRKRRDRNLTSDSGNKAKNGGIRKSSIRKKLFRQNASPNLWANVEINHQNNLQQRNEVPIHEKRKTFRRMDTIPMPQIVRMSSAP